MTLLPLLPLRRLGLLLAGLLLLLPVAQAHLMLAQRGTINLVGDGAFMVLSLPVSAFHGIDDDGDGRLSTAEFMAHRKAIARAVEQQVQLLDAEGPRPLEGLMLSLDAPDDHPEAPAAHLVAMGRFVLQAGDSPLRFKLGLFGNSAETRSTKLAVTRAQRTESQLMVLAPTEAEGALFPPASEVFASFLRLGGEHILAGPDHLLFLFIVLATGWGWRPVVLALTAFTVGHACTLTLSLLGGVSLPAAVVEPAIALTLVGLALFDAWSQHRGRQPALLTTLSLVFVCALVHGLGLAGALQETGLDNRFRLLSLLGFNLGVELAQLAVALLVAGLLVVVRWLKGRALTPQTSTRLRQAARWLVLALGAAWFVERVISIP